MNILNTFTVKNLKKSRTRTIVTIIGIMLSTALIMAVTTFVSSFQQFMIDYSVYNNGNYFVAVQNADSALTQDIVGNDRYSDFSLAKSIGYTLAKDCENEYKPYIYIMGVDDAFMENMPVHLVSGRLPANDREIILPQHLYSNGGVYYELGDEVNWSVGLRVSEGYTLWQDTPYIVPGMDEGEAETLEYVSSMAYTVVGFYERANFEDYQAPGYTAITKTDFSVIAETGEGLYSVYFKTDKGEAYNEAENLLDKISSSEDSANTGSVGVSTNDSLLEAYFQSRYDSFNQAIIGIATILIIIIMVGSIMLIYNAFAISVSERTKQFGLLSSIGATKRQIKRAVIFEALTLSVAGITLGVLLGIGGVAGTLLILDPFIASVFGLPISIHLSVSWAALLIAVVVALITVLISAWIPATRAMKVTAIEAIRQNNDYKNARKQIKTSKFTGKLFGFEGTLAAKYFKRNKKKYRVTIISLFISIVLFISVSSFASYLMTTVEGQYEGSNFEIAASVYPLDGEIDKEELLEELGKVQNIDDVTCMEYILVDMPTKLNEQNMNKEYVKWLLRSPIPEGGESESTVDITIIDDESFRQYCERNQLDVDAYTNPDKPLFIASDNVKEWDSENERYRNFKAFNGKPGSIVLDMDNRYGNFVYKGELDADAGKDRMKKTFEIGYYSAELAPGCINKYNITIMTSQSMAQAIGIEMTVNQLEYFINTEQHTKVAKDIEELLEKGGMSYYVLDVEEAEEQNANLVFIMKVFAYGFIIMISLISITNVFNTISTNVMLRRKEFAMLKTVGMTRGGFNKMMNFECILYGSKAVLYGLPVSVGVSYLIYNYFNSAFEFAFYVPASAVIISVGVVFLVVFVTMLYSMHKIKKENVIDVLKADNF